MSKKCITLRYGAPMEEGEAFESFPGKSRINPGKVVMHNSVISTNGFPLLENLPIPFIFHRICLLRFLPL